MAVVPLKALDRAKSRLGDVLDAGARRELTAWMFGRVVAACRQAGAVDDVLVVAGDRAAADLAALQGVPAHVEGRPGLGPAMAAGDRLVAGAGASLVLAADLPLARSTDIDAVCAAAEQLPGGAPGPTVVVSPTRDGGTAALLRRPPGVMDTAFGSGSAGAHCRGAAAAGARLSWVSRPRLALDVDTPAALKAAAAADTDVRRWLAGVRCWVETPPARGDGMPQGTVKHFDADTHTGTVLLDTQEELPIDAEAFAASGLLELRIGQRVRFQIEDRDEGPRVRELNLVSL